MVFNLLNALAETNNLGLIAIGAGIAVFTGFGSSIGEAMICSHAIDGMVRNPEKQSMLNSTMILAVALDESCGIYGLLIAILCIFVLGGQAA